LRPWTQRKLFAKVRYEFKQEITLDAFACHQTKVVVRCASRLDEPTTLGLDGLVLDWRHEVVWVKPPWALFPSIIDNLSGSDQPPWSSFHIVLQSCGGLTCVPFKGRCCLYRYQSFQ